MKRKTNHMTSATLPLTIIIFRFLGSPRMNKAQETMRATIRPMSISTPTIKTLVTSANDF